MSDDNIKEIGSKSRLDPLKNLAKSKRKGLYIGLIIIIGFSVVLAPLIYFWVIGGNPFLPTVENEEDYIGYATIELQEYDASTGITLNFTGKGAFIDYNDTTQVIDSDVDFDGTTIYHMTKVTLAYLYLVNGASKTYINRTFLVLANADRNNPARNIITLYVKTIVGDLEGHIYDINGTRGEYHPSDLGTEQIFILGINSTNYTKPIGMNQFIPQPYRYDTRFEVMGLWLEVNSNVVIFTIDNNINGTWIYDSTLGVSYLLLPPNLYGDYKEYTINLNFETTPPTYFKYYDGIPISTDLILTDSA